MKYLCKETDDGSWHEMNIEMPCTTSDVEVKGLDNSIQEAEIVVEMSGYYIYFRKGEFQGWGSLNDYSHWRFINN